MGLDSEAASRSPSWVECGRCGRSNPDQVRYCLDCGSVLRAADDPSVSSRTAAGRVNCRACGVDNPRDSSFCRECGSSLRLGQAKTQLSHPPSPHASNGMRTSSSAGNSTALVSGSERDHPPGGTMLTTSQPACPPSGELGTLVSADGRLNPETPVPQAERNAALPVGAALQPGRHPAERGHFAAGQPSPRMDAPAPPRLETRLCRACGAKSGAAARFCQLCGLPLGNGSGERPRSNPPSMDQSIPRAQLVVIAQDGSPGRRYEIAQTQTTIGGAECTINLRKDPYVSPRHARITYRNGRFALEDLGSLNGVFVRLGGSVPLSSGDLLLLGLGVLRFEIVEESERNLAPQTRDGTRVFGTPPSPRYARLTTQTVEGVARDRHYLSRAETVLGREVGDIVFTDDPFMSRRHAAIHRDPTSGHFTVRDLGSSNGTFIALRGEHTLSPGDHIRVGQHLFRLDVRDDR